jgi:hypothetical protein
VQQDGLEPDEADEPGGVQAEFGGARGDRGRTLQPAGDADEDGCAHRAEADRRALDDQADHDGGHGGEAQGQQERRGHGGGGAEAGGALDEAAEQPADDDRLDAAVGADVGEGGADGGDGAALGEGGQQQERAEDDVEQTDREDEALDGGGGDRDPVGPPEEDGDGDHDDVSGGHRVHGREAEPDEQDADEDDRDEREEAE